MTWRGIKIFLKKIIYPSLIFLVFAALIYGCETDFITYHNSWVTALSALLVPTIALFGVFIAYRQSQIYTAQKRIANNRLRLDLFEKRFSIYDAARELISKIRAGNIKLDAIIDYRTKVREAKWFLNDDIHNYLNNQIYNATNRLQEIQEELKGGLSAPERKALVRDLRKWRDWITSQDDELDKKFSPYLKFRLMK